MNIHFKIFFSFVILFFSSLPCGEAENNIFIDDFNQQELSTNWSWLNENNKYWHYPGKLKIITQLGDMWQNDTDYKNILVKSSPQGDYEIEILFKFDPFFSGHQAGIVIRQDDENYMLVYHSYWINGTSINFGKEEEGEWICCSGSIPYSGSKTYLKLIKAGTTYSSYYSENGEEWAFVGKYENINFTNEKVGLYAFNTASSRGKDEIIAEFDYFKITQNEIIDKEDFLNYPLDNEWEWLNEDDTHWGMTTRGENLAIMPMFGDMTRQRKDYSNILLQYAPSGDYEIETKVFFNPRLNGQHGGIVIIDDIDNHIRLYTGLWNNKQVIASGREILGEYICCPDGAVEYSDSEVYLKVIKTGTTYSLYYGFDGEEWIFLGKYENVTFIDEKFGLQANNTDTEDILGIEDLVEFDYFKLTTPIPNSVIVSPKEDINIIVGDKVYFSGDVETKGDIEGIQYNWSMGDERNFSSLKDLGYITFSQLGHYKITLEVVDRLGIPDASSAIRNIQVKDNPPPSPAEPAKIELPYAMGQGNCFLTNSFDRIK